MLGEPDRDGEVGDDAIGVAVAVVAIEAGRQIDREDKGVLFPAQAIDFLGRRPDRLAQEMFRAEAEQAVEDDQYGGTCFCTSLDERKLVPPKVGNLLPRELGAIFLGKNEAKINFPAGLLQKRGGHERVATVMTFPHEDNRLPRIRKEF